MIKQILGRLPKKTGKAGDARDAATSNGNEPSNSYSVARSVEPGGNKRAGNGEHLPPAGSASNPAMNGAVVYHSNEPLPAFKDVPVSEKQNLFVRKATLCCAVYDFADPTKNLKEKEMKRQTLMELVDYVTSANGKFSEIIMLEISKMVAINLFRSSNPTPRENKAIEGVDMEEEEPLMDPAWSHLQIVYEVFLRFVASQETDAKLAKRYIDHSFILKLLDLFDSEDPRERDYLKTILHRIYELLEILGSIINGFALPLKEEHKLFLLRALIPLHKPKCVAMYHQQLSYCITQFVEKDCKLADTVIRGLLKYWPITNSSKEVMFLGELEEVLEATQLAEFQRCMVPLFRQIASSMNSSHFQVAERALFLWNNDHIENLIKQNYKVILPIIFPALERNARGHWNQAVRSLTLNVRKIFTDHDSAFFGECMQKFDDDELKHEESSSKREALWKRLEEMGGESSPSGIPNGKSSQ
ncbi:hypothetical protein CFC21_024238 [Triticum aestivum]|uniref:Serine/threonine protein phosphatase 2A regulatory subunit n=3 Tax=Triticum TaxID=4564 RepID=A0A9R1RPK4_TRITD|nr:hypothetical protein CFC21_024238 [Triticum aestivum]VAH48903.1 unnamed protein product [Triticum turgidum subsp. durum]